MAVAVLVSCVDSRYVLLEILRCVTARPRAYLVADEIVSMPEEVKVGFDGEVRQGRAQCLSCQ